MMFCSKKTFLWKKKFFKKNCHQAATTWPNITRFNKNFYTVGNEAVVILNHRIPPNIEQFFSVTGLIVCADGGCNRLYASKKQLLPQAIVGDLDSVKKKILKYYKQKEVKISPELGQNSNDFQKVLNYIKHEENSSKKIHDTIICLAGIGGNLSHTFANIRGLFDMPSRKIVLVSMGNIAFLIWPGTTNIQCEILKGKTTYCSLIPLGVVHSVTTAGLKWNLNQEINYGPNGLISTSNEITDNITIHTTDPLLFILDINH